MNKSLQCCEQKPTSVPDRRSSNLRSAPTKRCTTFFKQKLERTPVCFRLLFASAKRRLYQRLADN